MDKPEVKNTKEITLRRGIYRTERLKSHQSVDKANRRPYKNAELSGEGENIYMGGEKVLLGNTEMLLHIRGGRIRPGSSHFIAFHFQNWWVGLTWSDRETLHRKSLRKKEKGCKRGKGKVSLGIGFRPFKCTLGPRKNNQGRLVGILFPQRNTGAISHWGGKRRISGG